ncbi:immunoglobulin lambda-like polypeptide 1, partial [Megalops cyprinoides]|uniref:immunoglobulin lambda-like polypeptide 1 n=1 Tax=Megalops cyprinoides TaxID=118141 RepID=UPI0018655D7C
CLWDGSKVFGSGTKLIVTGESVRRPDVIPYPPSKENNGKKTLVCLARDMFPKVLKFKWDVEASDGTKTPVKDSVGQVEQQGENYIASMMTIDASKVEKNNYFCSVEHEAIATGDATQKKIPKEKVPDAAPKSKCPPLTNGTDPAPILKIIEGSFEQTRSLYLATLTYTLMILKGVAYLSVVSVVTYRRTSGSGPVF